MPLRWQLYSKACTYDDVSLVASCCFISSSSTIRLRGREFVSDLHCTVRLCHVTVWHVLRSFITDTNLETSGTPVDKLDGLFGPDSSNCRMDFLGNDVTAVKQTGCHVFAVLRVTFDHLVVWIETGQCHFADSVCFMGSPGVLCNGCIGKHGEMNTRERNKVGLELGQINIKIATETDRCRNRRYNCLKMSAVSF